MNSCTSMATNRTTPNPNEDTSALADETAFRRDLLAVVDKLDRPAGLRVQEQLEDYYPNEINHGRLYPNLDHLCNKGLIERGQQDRRTNWYDTTEKGQEALQEHVSWLEKCIKNSPATRSDHETTSAE